MRPILVLVSFLCTFGLSAAGVIQVAPVGPRVNQPVTFTLTGVMPLAGSQSWSFGDDSSATGSSTATHTYATARSYHVRVNFTLAASGPASAETTITVAPPFSSGPNAPFNLASVVLRWKEGQSSLSVPRDSSSLVAYADLKFEGTGHLQAQWLVDGQVVKTVTQAMSFAGKTTLDSGTTPVFPTSTPGAHEVTLKILNPPVNFRLPVIRYIVSLTAPQPPPVVESVTPPAVYAGQEAEIQITGQNLTQEMKLDFGSGITFLGPITVMSPMSAKVKVFVPPTVKLGFHTLAMIKGQDRLQSKARLEVRAPQKVMSGTVAPCPDQATFKQETVDLQAPDWQNELPDHAGMLDVVPTLTDFTVFEWSEKVQGAAEAFELRIYDKTGKHLILAQRLPGGAKQWNVTADFVPKLVNLVKGGGGATPYAVQRGALVPPGTKVAAAKQMLAPMTKPMASPMTKLFSGQATTQFASGYYTAASAAQEKAQQEALQKAQDAAERAAHLAKVADVLWQIVGLRDYTCLPKVEAPPAAAGGRPVTKVAPASGKGLPGPGKGGTLVQTVERSASPAPVVAEAPKPVKMTLEVEASEFWPLKLPDRAVGVSYGSCNLKAPGTTLGALPLKGGGVALTYPGDVFELKGNFTLEGSPYGAKPTHVDFANAGSGVVVPTAPIGCGFDNVFLDWGDGTPLQALSPKIINEADGSSSISLSSDALFELPAGQYQHAYGKPGTYNLRVFMLSEDDVQLAGFSSGASKALASKGTLDTNFLKLLKVATGTPGGMQALPAGGATPSTGFSKIGGMQVANSVIASSLLQTVQPSIQQILSRAYVILCDTKHIREFDDPCATKPLELVDLELRFDSPKGGVSLGSKNPALPAKMGKAALSAKPVANKAAKVASPSQLSLANQGAGQMSAQVPGFNAAGNYSLKVDAVTSTCNEAFGVRTRVRYFGHGSVRVTWKVDGVVVAVSKPTDLSMKPRTGLTKAQSEDKDCGTVTPAETEINLPEFLPVKTTGVHILTAQAAVVPESQKVDLDQAVLELSAIGQGGKNAVSPSTLALLGAASGGSGKRGPLKLGVLNPNPAPGMAQVVYVHDALPALGKTPALGVAGALAPLKPGIVPGIFTKPPYFVEAGQKTYRVEALDPKEPCSFDFPTKGGPFRVTDLAGHATMEVVGGVTRVTGTGKIKVALRAGEDATDERAAFAIDLAQWEVDGFEVTKGAVNLANLNQSINLPGAKGTLDSLKGKVQGKGKTEDMLARLTLIPSDASLTLTSNEKNTPIWTAERPLGSEGDFYAEGLALPETYLGRTPWTMKSASGVVLDYSHAQGQGPAGQGNQWVGVRLKQLALRPFSFELVADASSFPLVDTWYIGDGGLHGSVSFKNWMAKFQEGSIKVGSMDFDALGGQNYKATYRATEVQVPWFPSPLKGDITMSKTAEGFLWTYGDVKAPSMPKVVNGGFSLEPANLYFANEKNIAWTVMGDAKLAFQADGKPFAAFTLDRFCYHFDGRASFEQNTLSKTVTLNQKSSLGDTPADLKSVTVTTPAAGSSVVGFAFNTTLRLSESPLLPATDTVVSYHLDKTGVATYSAPPAATAPFELAMAFPLGAPTVNGKIHPVYAPGGSGTRYTGEVDLGLFGGPPFKTQFVLGYKGGKDYFLCRADIPLGPTGQVIVPELLTLYKIHGGIGYNFGVDAFKDNVSILNAQPDMKGNAIFSAGMRVGSSDSFIYMLDGTMTISTAAAARMDYDAWLLTANHGGQGQFKGWIQYGNGSFDGKLWGGLDMLGGLVQFSLGNSEANAAVDMHLGSDSWHIYAGQRNGARIKAKVITSGSDAYLMLGSQEGLAIGGSSSYYLGVGDSSVASAYAKAYLDVGLQVTPQPKIIGDFGAGMSAGVCVFGVCVDGGVNAAVHAEALPLDLRAACSLDLPWPLDDVSFTVHM